jgi:hypothetical protein
LENKKLLPISIILLAGSIVFSSFWIGNSLGKAESKKSTPVDEKKVLTLPLAAEYMNMTEKEITGIIGLEQMHLAKYKSFTGRMLPYFEIDDKKYFFKNELDEWVKDVSINQREYSTKEGLIKK